MKSTVLFGVFLISVLTSCLNSATADFVVDTDGDWLRNGGVYYILPVMRGGGGGIEQAHTGNETCPLTVVQSRNQLSKGLPIYIESRSRFPYLSVGDLIWKMGFTFVQPCFFYDHPLKWTIVKGLPEGPAVKLTGYENTKDGWFIIQKASSNSDYKLTFCTTVDGKCGNVGIYIDDKGIRRLVVMEKGALVVRFQKVGSPTASII